MTNLFQLTVFFMGSAIILFSLGMAIVVRNNVPKNYMKIFFLSPFISLLVSLNTFNNVFPNLYDKITFYRIQHSLNIFDVLFWAYFFIKLFDNSKDTIRIIALLFIALAIKITIAFFVNTFDSAPNFQLLSILNLFKAICCLYYFFKLFKIKPEIVITSEPAFWIVTGLLFYTSLSMPIYTLHNYFKATLPLSVYQSVFAITNIFVIVMHLFFIKAYLCITRLPKVF